MLDDRILLITGKGGVGRSVVAAALAHCLAAKGAAVLLCDLGASDGGYSPLARLFNRESFPQQPVDIQPHISACHLTPTVGHQDFLRQTMPGGRLLAAALKSPALQTLMETAPSFAEMGIFYQLLSYIKASNGAGQPRYQHIIVDLPATGHALALTGLPFILQRIIHHGPVARGLEEGQAYLNSDRFCHAWVVTLPEQLPVSEALELLAGLQNNKVPIGGLIMNRFPNVKASGEELLLLQRQVGSGVAGYMELERLVQAQAAQERLLATTSYELLSIPELALTGSQLVIKLAQLFAGACA